MFLAYNTRAFPANRELLLDLFRTRHAIAKLLGFNWDQVVMSQEDNTCDLGKFRTDFGWEPKPFSASLKSYISTMN